MLAADTETCLIRRGLKAPPLVCVSWADFSDGDGHIVGYKEARDICVRLFSGISVWANAAYDIAVIMVQFPDLIPLIFDAIENNRVYDVIIRQRLIDIGNGRYYKWYHDGKQLQKITYTVKALAKRLVGVDIEKGEDTWRLKYGLLREVPVLKWPRDAREYSENDAEILIPIFHEQEKNADMLKDQFRQVRADIALHLASCWGMRTLREAVEEIDRRTEEEYYQLRAELEDLGLLHNKGSRNTKMAKELLRECLPFELWKLTKTGYKKAVAYVVEKKQLALKERRPFNEPQAENEAQRKFCEDGYISLDEESCKSSKHPGLIKYARYGAIIKLRSTYVSAMWDGVEKPLQPRFLVLVDTGRISCSDPNLTNLPREPGIRECCVPRNGNVFVAADYDKAELVSLAETCIEMVGYSRLGDRLIQGFDPHLDMGSQILGVSYEQALGWKKDGGRLLGQLRNQLGVAFRFPSKVDVHEDINTEDYLTLLAEHARDQYNLTLSSEQLWALKYLDDATWSRQMAKAANFGFPGGLGPETFVEYARGTYGVELTIEEAAELRRKWHRAWPEMQDYFREINYLLDGGTGRIIQPISHRYRGGVSYTQCCNGFFQSRTADGAKAACWEVTRRQFTERSSDLFGTHLVCFVHDELILEAPEHRAHEVGMELRDVMVQEFCKFHPNMAKGVSAEPLAMYYWSKNAKPVYENDRLVPWGERKLLAA